MSLPADFFSPSAGVVPKKSSTKRGPIPSISSNSPPAAKKAKPSAVDASKPSLRPVQIPVLVDSNPENLIFENVFAVDIFVGLLASFNSLTNIVCESDALRDFEQDMAEISTDQTRQSQKISKALQKELADQEQTEHEERLNRVAELRRKTEIYRQGKQTPQERPAPLSPSSSRPGTSKTGPPSARSLSLDPESIWRKRTLY